MERNPNYLCPCRSGPVCGSDQILSLYKQLQANHCLAELWDAVPNARKQSATSSEAVKKLLELRLDTAKVQELEANGTKAARAAVVWLWLTLHIGPVADLVHSKRQVPDLVPCQKI